MTAPQTTDLLLTGARVRTFDDAPTPTADRPSTVAA